MSGTEWGEWDAEPGENPADCLRSENADKITLISNVVTPGAITDGDISDGAVVVGDTDPGAELGEYVVDGAIEYGAINYGDVVRSNTGQVFAAFSGVTKPLAMTVPVA